MKHFTLLICLLPALLSCTSSDKNLVNNYLKKTLDSKNKIEVLKTEKMDSLYTPFNRLLSISYRVAVLSCDISKAEFRMSSSGQKPSVGILIADSMMREYNKIQPVIELKIASAKKTIDDPTIKNEFDKRKAIKAIFKVNDELHEAVFYFDENENEIGHSSLDNEKMYWDLDRAEFKLHQAFRGLEDDRLELIKGKN